MGTVPASSVSEPAGHREPEVGHELLLRRLRLPGGGAAVLRELELYRVFDVATSWYHARMTAGVPAGHLVFVRQGKHGAVSLMIVGGRRMQDGDDAEEFTLLVRGC